MAAPTWREEVLHQLLTGSDEGSPWPGWTLSDLVADDGEVLAHQCERQQVSEGLPAISAVRCVLGEICEAPAVAISRMLAFRGAGLLLSEMDVRWHVAYEGEASYLLGEVRECGTVLLPPSHPWRGRDGTQNLPCHEEVQRAVIDDFVKCFCPVVEQLRRFAKVGRGAMWDEAADMLGLGIAYLDRDFDGVERDRLISALSVPSAPWRRMPLLTSVETPRGQRTIYQKGGCCFAYKGDAQQRPALDPPDYCSTCRFRDREDVMERQLVWHRDRSTTPALAPCEDRPTGAARAAEHDQENQ